MQRSSAPRLTIGANASPVETSRVSSAPAVQPVFHAYSPPYSASLAVRTNCSSQISPHVPAKPQERSTHIVVLALLLNRLLSQHVSSAKQHSWHE